MAFGIGNLNQIVADFSETLSQIFGGGQGGQRAPKGGVVRPEVGGIARFDSARWTGNAKVPNQVRYGFATLTGSIINSSAVISPTTGPTSYYLDIPPQSITQKEVFATNIQATRKGIIVESEGVVFKDIVIQGTTGVFPGHRGGFNGPQANFTDITAPPSAPAGVDAKTGRSKDSSEKVVSGYEEFLGLRQFFLNYAADKVKTNGDLFLVFLNEKDNQSLIVEPLEFTMERSSKSPMTYNYKIVLKSIGNLTSAFRIKENANPLNVLDKIGNVAANVSAAVGQGRAAINATAGLFRKTFQAIDQTINGPLLQVQMACEDLANGFNDTLALPATFVRNFNQSTLLLRDLVKALESKLEGATTKSEKIALTAQLNAANLALANAENANAVPIPRSFITAAKATLTAQSDNFADSLNLGDPLYDQIKGRVVTSNPSPLKVASDDELILLGNLSNMAAQMNSVLASNNMFESDAETAFENARKAFEDPTVPQSEQLVTINKPDLVKEALIENNDTLERMASRMLGNANRWPEIVVLNRLKPPYIDPAGGDGVRKPGTRLLIPSS